MARINTALLVLQATEIGGRANFVRQDPAVVKAAKVALADIAQAGRSTYAVLEEASASWQRSARGRLAEHHAQGSPDLVVNDGPAGAR